MSLGNIHGMDVEGPGGGPEIPIVVQDGARGSMAAGVYSYKISYYNSYGETFAGPATAPFTVTVGSAKLTNIPKHPYNYVSGRKIYRTTATGLAPWRLIATIHDNLTTSYVDLSNDSALGVVEPNKNTASSLAIENGWTASSKPQVHPVVSVVSAGATLDTSTIIGDAEYALVDVDVNLTGVRLPALTPLLTGLKVSVKNTSAVNSLYVYPYESSNSIDALALGGPFMLGAGATQDFISVDGTTWSTVSGGSAVGGAVASFSAAGTGLTPAIASTGAVTLGGILDVDNGGTGVVTLPPGGIVYGNGTSPAGVSVGTPGQLLVSGGGAAPGWTAITYNGSTLTGIPAPSGASDATPKSYVDAAATGFNVHAPARLVSTVNLASNYNNGSSGVNATLTSTGVGALLIDGVAVALTNRVLLTAQAPALRNGVYDVIDTGSAGTPWILRRSSDFDNSPTGEVKAGDFVFITAGTTLASTGWVLTGAGTGPGNSIIIGTDSLNFAQFSSAGTYTAGTGLNLIGNTFSNTGVLTATGGLTGLTFTPSAGNVVLGGVLNVANGGTGLSSLTSGGIVYANTATTTTTTGPGAAGDLLISNGTAPTYQTLTGDATITSGGVINVNRITGAAGAGGTGMRVASTGSSIFVGYTATVPTGSSNTAMGSTALNAVTGGGNSAFGSGAGASVVGGTNNTFLGSLSNAGASTNGAIAIGRGATAGADNVTVIGDGTITASQPSGLYMRHRAPGAYTVNLAGFIAGTSELVEVSSSIRTKENVRDLEHSTLFDRIRAVRYTPKVTPGGVTAAEVRENIGFIAEEIVDLYPEVVTFDREGLPAGVMYDRIVPVLVEQVQSLSRQVVALCKIVDTLRAEAAAK